MAAPDKKDGAGLPVALLATVLVALAGILVGHWQLVGTRPSPSEIAGYPPGTLQDVPGRLWQDPFAAIDQYLKRPKDAAADQDPESQRSGRERFGEVIVELNRSGTTPDVVGAMVFGGDYPEYAEQRRRTRYAVVSALSTARFVPEQPEGLGFITPSAGLHRATRRPRAPAPRPFRVVWPGGLGPPRAAPLAGREQLRGQPRGGAARGLHAPLYRIRETRGWAGALPRAHRLGDPAVDGERDGRARGLAPRHDVLLDGHRGECDGDQPAQVGGAGHRYRPRGDGRPHPRAQAARHRSHSDAAAGSHHPRVRMGHDLRARAAPGFRIRSVRGGGSLHRRPPALGAALHLSARPRRQDPRRVQPRVEDRR